MRGQTLSDKPQGTTEAWDSQMLGSLGLSTAVLCPRLRVWLLTMSGARGVCSSLALGAEDSLVACVYHCGTSGDALLCPAGRGPPCSSMLGARLTMSVAVLQASRLPAGLQLLLLPYLKVAFPSPFAFSD